MSSPQDKLQNLLKIGQIKAEQPDQSEFDGLLKSAGRRLQDAENPANSPDGRFDLAYSAAHSLALAALRWHGFRSEHRYTVFHLLQHTLAFENRKVQFLVKCHVKRNNADYEGGYTEDELLIRELIAVTKDLQTAVEGLGAVGIKPS